MSRQSWHERCVLVAGGGTGGHVFPALAVADALVRRDPDVAVEFVGTAGGPEARLVPAEGWRLHTVAAPKLARRWSLRTAVLPLLLIRETIRVSRLMRRRRVAVAASFGGYTSVPLTLAAAVTRTPLVVHEQNAVLGLANRLAARWAAAVATTFPDTAHAPGTRVVTTGNPLRLGDTPDAGEARAALGLECERATLLIFGGSQGARSINDALLATAGRWARPEAIQLLHIAGERDHGRVEAGWRSLRADEAAPRVRCEAFVPRMELAYAAADAVVCRAGASTIAEITARGLPAVLVPYPYATDDHQMRNAEALATYGGAVVFADAELDAVALVGVAEAMLTDPHRREAMAAGQRRFAAPQAAEAVAGLVAARLPPPTAQARTGHPGKWPEADGPTANPARAAHDPGEAATGASQRPASVTGGAR
jgi:UDP-N-acetylglucosamine--N-acetylmuramyl-(pentapeptide) pyrophosphoryl-undecaprenol N-acetylglucosamine transferase